ncbi:MAG: hypothetical protein IPH57_03375 [Saprospiraceae bacterium]|nr:hypothetical protein [Saprospiraceae bacterium]
MVENQTKLNFAGLWLLVLLLLPALVLWPVYSNDIDFPFYAHNILIITAPVFFLRYIFFIKYSFIEKTIIPKLIIMPVPLILGIYSYVILNDFIGFYNNNGIYYSLESFSLDKQEFLGNYLFRQFIFFGAFTIITCLIIPFRMLISVWRVYNKGTE